MRKYLTKHGNSAAMVIDKPILELMGADLETQFEITMIGNNLLLSPLKDDTVEHAFEEAYDWTSKKYVKALKRLAE